MASMERVLVGLGATPGIDARPAVLGAMAGGVRARLFGARVPSIYRWMPYDSLEILPYLLEAQPAVSAVVVDLVRWNPLKAAADLRVLRRQQADLRIVCLYEPGRDSLVQLKGLAELDLGLAFAVAPDARFELLLRPVALQRAGEAPTVGRSLLDGLVPLATDAALEAALIQLSLVPSHGLTVPELARIAGCSVDGLERRLANADLGTPAAMRGLAADAEGLWQVAALNRSAQEAARAVGVGTADSLGRMLKRRWGFGLRMARLVGAAGARQALRWVGVLALREFTRRGGWPQAGRVRLARRGAAEIGSVPGVHCQLDATARAIWEVVADGTSLEQLVDRCSEAMPADQLPTGLAPAFRALLRRELLALEWVA